jgi:hypothetical protein
VAIEPALRLARVATAEAGMIQNRSPEEYELISQPTEISRI